MLNSCASNVTVVNIDNGFGAGFVASLINRRREDDREDDAATGGRGDAAKETQDNGPEDNGR
jgi:hypothetical protein